MCACVCISVCMHACMCVLQAKECMHACTCTHAYVHVCAQACVHVFVCTCLHECIRVVCASVLLSDMHCSVPDDPPVGHTHPPGTPGPASGTRPPQRPHKWRQAAHPHPAAGWPRPGAAALHLPPCTCGCRRRAGDRSCPWSTPGTACHAPEWGEAGWEGGSGRAARLFVSMVCSQCSAPHLGGQEGGGREVSV